MRLLSSPCLSVSPSVSRSELWEPLNGFSQNLILGSFTKIWRHIPILLTFAYAKKYFKIISFRRYVHKCLCNILCMRHMWTRSETDEGELNLLPPHSWSTASLRPFQSHVPRVPVVMCCQSTEYRYINLHVLHKLIAYLPGVVLHWMPPAGKLQRVGAQYR